MLNLLASFEKMRGLEFGDGLLIRKLYGFSDWISPCMGDEALIPRSLVLSPVAVRNQRVSPQKLVG